MADPNEAGVLYLVATPIGNLADFSPRARDILLQVDTILCEDTRVTRKLLSQQGISKALETYHDHCERMKTPALLERLQAGENFALVSDAGTPAISDPGFRLVNACRREGITVTPIPGPSALIAALSASGLPTNGFLFLGFPPVRPGARKKLLEQFCQFPYTLIFYESCHHIKRFLEEIFSIYGKNRRLCVAKELSKIHETFFCGTSQELFDSLSTMDSRGEFVVLIAPSDFQS